MHFLNYLRQFLFNCGREGFSGLGRERQEDLGEQRFGFHVQFCIFDQHIPDLFQTLLWIEGDGCAF